jgi:hypothetical protein
MIKDGKPNVKTAKAFYLALVAGILIITNGVLLGVVAKWFIEIMPTLPGSSGNDPTLLIELATAGMIFGALVLLGALMIHFSPQNNKAGSIMIIVFSIPSVIMGGGFIIGFILGLLGGIIALSKKSVSQPLTKVS